MRVDDVEIVAVVEEDHWLAEDVTEFIDGGSQTVVDANRSWLEPAGQMDPETGRLYLSLQAFLVRTPETVALIDTNLGDRKEWPAEAGKPQRTTWGPTLERFGVDPESVDVVMTTHLHGDHVGGNTTLVDGRWVPTFPNANYLIHGADVDYWRDTAPGRQRNWPMMRGVFDDSVAPIETAGALTTWSGRHRVDPWIELREAPGHTPGLSTVRVTAGSTSLVFVGDLIHLAVQLVEPDWGPTVDEDPSQAALARRSVLGEAADSGAIVVPGHFPGARAFRPRREADHFAVGEWVEL